MKAAFSKDDTLIGFIKPNYELKRPGDDLIEKVSVDLL
jgi:hypothetical protein